jgi:predicted ATPase
VEEAAACFEHFLAVAHQRHARGVGAAGRHEPRPALSRSRAGARRRALLAPVYGRFTEGFDTADLREAKALLDELNAS